MYQRTSNHYGNEGEREPLINGHVCNSLPAKKPKGLGARHVFAVLAFLGFVNVYSLRVSLSVALVAMVKNNDTKSSNNSSSSGSLDQCPVKQTNVTSSNHKDYGNQRFDWDEDLQGIILGSFFYGYLITQMPGGRLAEKYGGKNLFGYGILITSVLSLVTPPLTNKWGAPALITLRVLMGIGEGVTFPAMHSMLGKWCPRLESSILTTFVHSGSTVGSFLALPIAGALSQSSLGWSSVFYILGGVSCVWVLLWLFFAHSTPAEHPTISRVERQYIESAVGIKMDLPVPWREIVTSRPVWAICIVSFTSAWGYYTMLVCVPTYISVVQKFDLSQDGFLSALPTIVGFPIGNMAAFLADYLRDGRLSTTTTRKLLTFIALFIASACLPFVQFFGCDHVPVIALLTLSGAILSVAATGFPVNHIDLAFNFAGTLLGITNSFATAAGMLAPLVVGVLTNNNNTMHQWQIVFYISAALYFFGAVVYVILGEGSEQPWNRPDYNSSITITVDINKETCVQRQHTEETAVTDIQ